MPQPQDWFAANAHMLPWFQTGFSAIAIIIALVAPYLHQWHQRRVQRRQILASGWAITSHIVEMVGVLDAKMASWEKAREHKPGNAIEKWDAAGRHLAALPVHLLGDTDAISSLLKLHSITVAAGRTEERLGEGLPKTVYEPAKIRWDAMVASAKSAGDDILSAAKRAGVKT